MAQIDINDLRFEICRGFDIFMQALNDSVQFKRYDKCLDAEVYFIPVLNEILKNKISNPTCNLVPCPPGKTAIDLVDDLNHITFQVSKQKTSKKIRDTFELFIKNKYFKEYNKLYFLFIVDSYEPDIHSIINDYANELPDDFICTNDHIYTISKLKTELANLNEQQLYSISKYINRIDPFKFLNRCYDKIKEVRVQNLNKRDEQSTDLTIIEYLFKKQIYSIPWNDMVKEKIYILYNKKYILKNKKEIDLIKKLHDIKFEERTFEEILIDIKVIIDDHIVSKISNAIDVEIKEDKNNEDNIDRYIYKDNLRELNNLIKNPVFNRVLLLTGTAGSGKTHNIIKLISYQVDDDTSEIINDIIPIYISISENSKIDLKKPLSIFIDYNKFKENEEYLNYLSVLFKNKKIVIVLDGIEYYNGDLIEIFKLIVDSSKFNNIYWILSINKNYLDDVIYGDTEHNRFTKKYSVCFDHIEKQKPNNQFLNDNIEIDILFFNEWINIDYLNIKYQVQYEIISKTFDNLILDKEFDIYNYCPQISWIICDIATANNINSLLNLPYHKIFVKLEESFKYIKLSKKNLAIIIEYICEFIIENKTEKISKIVINELTNLLFVNLLHNNHPNDLSKNILNDLLQNNLISISSSNIYKSDINLSTEIYWSYKVSEIFDKNQNQNNLADGNLSKIFLHRVYEFFILNLNNQEDEEDLKNLEALIFGIFNDNLGPKSSIWFTADKLCPRVRYKVERKITEATIYKNHIYDDRHDLYSFMLYLCNYEIIYTKFNYIKKLSVLQNIIYDVKYFNLNQIYFDICKGIVSPINNVEDIFRSVKYFEKCHCLGNKDKMNDLAQYISKRIFVIADESESEEDEYVKISNLIFKYVFDPEFIRKRERDSDNNWIRYYFWEFLLNNLCLKFAYALDMSVYSFFKLNNWYNKSNNISLFVETEANIAVGSLFSYKKANHQFLKFTNDLYDFGDLKDKENCLYIIKHTTPNNSNYLNNANICFDKLLNIIYNNHKLKFDKGSQSWLFNQILRKY